MSASPLRSVREGPIKGEPSPAYARHTSAITSAAALLLLEPAEAAVLRDPLHRHRRLERADRAITDWNTEGVILAYDMPDADTVVFHAFLFTLRY